MEWGKLFANLPNLVRVQNAEADGAGWLLIESMCYCTSAESGGFIPHTQIERFGGGPKKKQKIAALVREGIWVPVELGYLLDPELWNEERNLSDSAEKKRKADRDRQAAKRAAKVAQNGDVSRDSRATSRATVSATRSATHEGSSRATEDATSSATGRRDSRTPEKRREEIDSDVVSHPTVVVARQPDDDDDHGLVSAVVGAFLERTGHLLSDADARVVAAVVLGRADRGGVSVHHAARYVAAAIAGEPDPFGLLGDPPPLSEILADLAPGKPVVPVRCGKCDPVTRMREAPGDGRPYRCPECHPGAGLAVGSG